MILFSINVVGNKYFWAQLNIREGLPTDLTVAAHFCFVRVAAHSGPSGTRYQYLNNKAISDQSNYMRRQNGPQITCLNKFNSNFRYTSGKISGEIFFPKKFYWLNRCVSKFQPGSLGIVFVYLTVLPR